LLGRARAFALAGFVFFKINFFFWLLFAWVGMGVEWSYRYNSDGVRQVIVNGKTVRQQTGPNMIPRRVDPEQATIFCVFAAGFAMVGRMLLLRWQRGWCVGIVLAGLVVTTIALGAQIARWGEDDPHVMSPFTTDFCLLMALAGTVVALAASIVWPIWVMLVRVFLPRPWSTAVLEWQTYRPASASLLARD
jgi:hypothetical protein